jgi:hypothetical protein
VALVEAYDADESSPSVRFVNMSARTGSGARGETLTIGFVLTGNAPTTLLVRGIGPTLTRFGVGGVLPDPELTVFDEERRSLARNNDWGGSATLSTAFARVGAFPLATDSKDAALLITFMPGAYTVQISGAGGQTGIALVEVYEVRGEL